MNANRTLDDRILVETRVVAAVVIVVLILAHVVLYIYPDQTDKHFAWTIKPNMTAMLMGAGYIAGGYFFIRVLTERKWHRVQLGFLPITGFTVFMIVATFLHWDRFHQDTFEFFLWTAIYLITPLLVPFIWWRNRVTDPGTPDANDTLLPPLLRQVLKFVGIAGIAASLLVFIVPNIPIAFFPWALTPLTARVICGWSFLASATLVSIASDARWSAARILIQSGTIGAVLLLIAIARDWGAFNVSNPLTWVFVVSLVALIILFVGAYFRLNAAQNAQPASQIS